MHNLELKIPPLIIASACAVVIWGLAEFVGSHTMATEIRRVLALLLAVAAIAITLLATIPFMLTDTTIDPRYPNRTTVMINSGIYRFSRNPIYLGMALILAALSLWLGARFGLFVVAAFILYINRFQIEPEERALQQRFGETYDNYRSRVRRWI